MGKSKKELKRLESVAFIMLEVLDRAIKMKGLQLDELKMKQNHEKEMMKFPSKISVQEKPLNVYEKYPSGGISQDSKNWEEGISIGEKISRMILGGENCECPVCILERKLKRNGQA